MDITEKIDKYLNEAKQAKGSFASSEGFNYAVKINGVPDDYPKMPFGRKIDYRKQVKDFMDTAKKDM